MSAKEPTPKPDGWHTYHVCDGRMRELRMLTPFGTVGTVGTWEAMCVTCGQWFRGVITDERQPEARHATLERVREGVERLRPAPNLQGSPVNAYCNARDAVLALLKELDR